MDRLDARTASFFAIGLLVLTFGCKSGPAFKALGAGAASVAKVAVAAAAVAAVSNNGPARERGEVVREGGAPVNANCRFVCPVDAEDGTAYVCATPSVVVDARTNENRIVYLCHDEPMAFR